MTQTYTTEQPIRLGIDFGTTHTSAAFFDGAQIRTVPLDPLNANPNLLRSMIYVTRTQEQYLGLEAVQTFLEHDTGRSVIYEDKYVGTIEYTVAQQYKGPLEPDGPITIIQDVTIADDVGVQGRLLQSIKTGLRSDSYTGTDIFGRYYSLQELIALILGQVRTAAEQHLGRPIRQATLGRPVQFSPDPAADQRAQERLGEAAALAGFEEVDFVPEPVAAATFYLNQVTKPETVLIFDFGGGTLDLTVMRAADRRVHEMLATHGVLVGGDDLDSSLMRQYVAQYFGAMTPIDTNFDGRPIPFPEDLADELKQWQTIPNLSRPKALAVMKRALRFSPEAAKFAALETLVMQNYGFALFEQIEQAKRRLSYDLKTKLQFQAETIDLKLELRRREFNQAINEERSLVREGIQAVIDMAGVTVSEIDAVVTTGGSSVIPIFQKMLTTLFPNATLVPLDTFSGVTNGLALRAYQSLANMSSVSR
ncbi:MAG: Hsp70 family protein [Caldilineaceae bacterium]